MEQRSVRTIEYALPPVYLPQRIIPTFPLWFRVVKRSADIALSLVALLILWPLFGIISLLIKLDSPGPVFYFHERLSFQGRPIRIIKFRTMVDGADKRLSDEEKREFEKQYKLKKDWRVTPLGRTLRRISLDELPQLINSLKGDISIVGPRPIVYKELEKYGDDAEKFLSVKPGLTGFWQAYGRGDVDYETRRRLELRYVEEASIWLDIKILFKTVEQIVLRGGV